MNLAFCFRMRSAPLPLGHSFRTPCRFVHRPANDNAKPARPKKLKQYQETDVATDIRDVELKTRSLRSGISTLKLDKAIAINQWFHMNLDRSCSKIQRNVMHDDKILGHSCITIPHPASDQAQSTTEEWVCPYVDTESQTLRLRLRSGADYPIEYSVERLSNKWMRPLGELALAEGLIQSLPERSKTFKPQKEGIWKLKYERAVQSGYSGSIQQFLASSHAGYDESYVFINTLHREKALATGSTFTFRLKHGVANQLQLYRRVAIDGSPIGHVWVHLPAGGFPAGTTEVQACVFFDPVAQALRVCTPEGQDIPRVSIPLMTLASDRLRPLLELAHAEGLLDKIPAGALPTFDLTRNIESGFYLHCTPEAAASTPTRYRTRIAIRLANGTSQPSFRVTWPGGVEEVRCVPYIDEEEKLRLRDLDSGRDLEGSGSAMARDGIHVRNRYPKLFAYAQSLGHWKDL